MLRYVGRSWSKFLQALDREIVSLYQTVFYVFLIACAIYNLFIVGTDSQPPSTDGAITGHFYTIWLYLLLVFPAVVIAGKALKGDFMFSGMLMQFFGDVACLAAVFAFFMSGLHTTNWGHEGNFACFISCPLLLCIGVLTFRDSRRIWQVERRVRR